MKHTSLIQSIILLQEKDCFTSNKHECSNIEQLNPSRKNMDLARKLIHGVLGRNLKKLSPETKVLFLLIEKLEESEKSNRDPFRFTLDKIRMEIGWSMARIKRHLNRLEKLHFIYKFPNENQLRTEYGLRQSSKTVKRYTYKF